MVNRSLRKWITRGVWFTVIFVLFFFVMDRFERSPHNPELKSFDSKNSIETLLSQSSALDYTDYTVRRLGLKPIPFVDPLQADINEPVINDVLSFQYPVDIDHKDKPKCRHWANASLDSTNTDANLNRTLLIVVISAVENFARRDLIRQTWASPHFVDVDEWIEIIFLVGTTLFENQTIQDRLQKENVEYKDLVQVNVVDSYANLTLKSIALLHWAHGHCPGAQLVFKCDDDNYINWNVLSKILPNLNDTRSIYGTPVPTLYAERWKSKKL